MYPAMPLSFRCMTRFGPAAIGAQQQPIQRHPCLKTPSKRAQLSRTPIGRQKTDLSAAVGKTCLLDRANLIDTGCR